MNEPSLAHKNKRTMAELTTQQKRDFARTLYIKENLTQQEIAERVGISRQSLSRWMKDEQWELQKASLTLTREQQIAALHRQIAALNDAIASRAQGENFATPAEADTITKIANAIKKLETETGLADIISVGIRFLDYLRPIDLELSKQFTRLWDGFIKENV